MHYRVADLLKSPLGKARWVELSETVEAGLPGITVLDPIEGRLRLMRDPAGILVQGTLSTRLLVDCARCNVPVETPIEVDLEEHFRPTVLIADGPQILSDPEEDDEPETRLDEQHVLDLSGVLWQNLELALPARSLCRPDCKGLCASCGADLNEGGCECEPTQDPRWSDLRVLMEAERDGAEGPDTHA
jgi:uncharacterized protein